MEKMTQHAVEQFAALLRQLGAPNQVLDGFIQDTEIVFGLPGQDPTDPRAAAERVAHIKASLREARKDPQLMERMPAALKELLDQAVARPSADAVSGMLQMPDNQTADQMAELIKKQIPGAEVKVMQMSTLILAGLVHDLKHLDLPEVNKLRSFRAAQECVKHHFPEDPTEPELTTEQQTMLDNLKAAGVPQEKIDDIRTHLLRSSS
jgi:hypothetical protein